MNKPILKFALAMLLLLLFGGAAVAEDRDAPAVFVQFVPEKGEGHAGISLTSKLGQADNLPAGVYRAKAKVRVVTEKAPEVIDDRAMEWRAPTWRVGTEDNAGWGKREEAWIWKPDAVSAPLVLPFAAAQNKDGRETNLLDFDELWMDFVEAVPGEPCRISMTMNVVAKSGENGSGKAGIHKLRLESRSSGALSPTLRIDLAGANWMPRDNAYLTKRVLGLGFDEDWRYIQDKKNAVIQRRFHQDLQNVEALDLLFKPGVAVERVNLQLSRKDRLNPDEVIDWDVMPKQIESTAEGARVRLHLGDAVRARLAAQKRDGGAFLAEMVIFIAGEAERVVAQRPLRALVFQSMQEASRVGNPSDTIYLPQRKEPAPPGYGRLAIDLRPLAKKGWQGIGFMKGIATLRPGNPKLYCGIRPASLRLVTLGQKRQPILVGDVMRFSEALGGPFLMPSSEGSDIEWIEVDSYLPFNLLSVQPQEIKPGDRELEFPGWGLVLRVNSVNSLRIEKEPSGVVLIGAGGEVRLLWERPIKMDRESRLMLRVSDGVEHISDARAEIEFDDGERVFVGFVANQAAVLGSPERAWKTIRRMTIRLKMKETSYRLKFGELLLFHPRLIQPGATVHAPRPGLEFIPLAAMEVKAPARALLTAGGNRVYGVAPGSERQPAVLFWSTPVHQMAGALVALQFEHQMSALADKPCWLTVTLSGKNRQVTQQLCPGGAQGKLIEPLTQLLNDFPPDEMVYSISWKAQLPASRYEAFSFDFQAHMGTVRSPSMADLLQNHPLLRIGQQSNRPAVLADETLKDLARHGSVWLDLGSFDWPGGKLFPPLASNHSYFHLVAVNLESSATPTSGLSARLPAEDKHSDSPWLSRLIMFGLLLLVTAWVWLRRHSLRRSRKQCVRWARSAWLPCRSILGMIAGRAWRTTLRFGHWANRAVGVFMLIPGFWLLGYMKDAPLTRGMAGVVLLFSVGSLWHELRWRHCNHMERTDSAAWWFGSSDTIPAFVLFLTAIVTGWAAWKLGRGDIYGVLPLVAVGYYYLPWLALAARWVKTGNGTTWAWVFLTVALYLLGLRFGVGRGESYFFTLGGLTAVLAYRAWAISNRARFELHWPAAAQRVYGGAGTMYFAGALAGLILTALLTALKVKPITEQVAIVVYYFLAVGTMLEILALRRESHRKVGGKGKSIDKDTAG